MRGTSHLSPERRSEIARIASAAVIRPRGRKPCHTIPCATCQRCKARASEQRSRAKRALASA